MNKRVSIRKRVPVCWFGLCFCGMLLASPAVHRAGAEDIPKCRNTSPVITPGDLTQVLFVVAGNFSEQEQGNLNIEAIMADTTAALEQAGIKATVVGPEISPESSADTAISASRFLRIWIYSIMLERQVYFCSAKIIQRQPSGEECFVREYSNVVSLARKIREVTADLVSQVLQDVRW